MSRRSRGGVQDGAALEAGALAGGSRAAGGPGGGGAGEAGVLAGADRGHAVLAAGQGRGNRSDDPVGTRTGRAPVGAGQHNAELASGPGGCLIAWPGLLCSSPRIAASSLLSVSSAAAIASLAALQGCRVVTTDVRRVPSRGQGLGGVPGEVVGDSLGRRHLSLGDQQRQVFSASLYRSARSISDVAN